MNNQSIGVGNNETFFGTKESMISDNSRICNDGNTKMSDVSKEFRELNGEIYKTIQNTGDASGISNSNPNNTNTSIGILLDDTWVNRKGSPDTSENFQLKMDQIKKKGKTPISKHNQQIKHTITIINNPQKTGSQFQMRAGDKKSEIKNELNNVQNVQVGQGFQNSLSSQARVNNYSNYANYNQNIQKNVQKLEEEDQFSTDDVPTTTEEINKLHINSVKTNNLRELNMYRNNYNQFNTVNNCKNLNSSNLNDLYDCNDEFGVTENLNNRDLSKKSINPKFIERNINTSTRFSTNESNESNDSAAFNKFGGVDEKYSYNTPVFQRNYPHTPLVQYPQGKKISFNNFNNNGNNFSSMTPTSNQFIKSSSSGLPNFNGMNGNMMNMNGLGSDFYYGGNFSNQNNMKNINMQNLPENAFSYNLENPMHMKSLSEKKKKKSKDEVDQTLFIINTDNILRGMDKRTTIMIRHIPNKYSSQSLLEEINVNFKGKYDFFYLPMDFENQCNLGYAFVNFVDPLYILFFYDIFKARKWKKYKSHKECDLSYAKFQGKLELTSHLEKSCVMNKMGEDKKPIIVTPPDPLPKPEIPIVI